MQRHTTRTVEVGTVSIGGGAPISVQSMTTTDTRDPVATLAQIQRLAAAGCEIVRVAIPKRDALPAFGQIRSAGMLLVKALNEGRTLVEMAPREKITQEFLTLADAVLGIETTPEPAKAGLRLFGRPLQART